MIIYLHSSKSICKSISNEESITIQINNYVAKNGIKIVSIYNCNAVCFIIELVLLGLDFLFET